MIVKLLIAVLVGLIVFWVLGWLGLPSAIALVLGVLAGIVTYLYG